MIYMKFLTLSILAFFVSCNNSNLTNYKKVKIMISNNSEFEAQFSEVDEVIRIQTALTGNKEMKLKKDARWGKDVFSGSHDGDNHQWKISEDKNYEIETVVFAPYYSSFSLNFFNKINSEPSLAHLRPDCHPQTSHLIVMFLSAQQFPLIGCIK